MRKEGGCEGLEKRWMLGGGKGKNRERAIKREGGQRHKTGQEKRRRWRRNQEKGGKRNQEGGKEKKKG